MIFTFSSGIFADHRTDSASYQQQKNKKDSKITPSTPGMDQVLDALQLGNTTNESVILNSVEGLQAILKSFSSVQTILRAVLRRYRPLSESILDAVCEHCPSPSTASSPIREHALALQKGSHSNFTTIQNAVQICETAEGSPTVAHVCKFLSANKSDVSDPELSTSEEDGSSQSIILGLARVLSGTLRSKDVEYFMYGPKHKDGDPPVTKRSIRLYLLMGSSFVRVNSVPAGHICAIYDLEDLQLKTVTLCDVEGGMPLSGFGNRGLQPLVKVNIEPVITSGESLNVW